MRTNDQAWLTPALAVIAYVDPGLGQRIDAATQNLTVLDDAADMFRLTIKYNISLMDTYRMVQGFDHSFGMTIRPTEDQSLGAPLSGDIWLNRTMIERKAEELDVPAEEFAAGVIAHEFRHHEGYGEPEAYDAGTEFARKLGVPAMVQFSERSKVNQAMEDELREYGLKPMWMAGDEPVVITGEENIRKAHLLALRSALKLETHGLRRGRGRSALAIVNEMLGTHHRTAVKAYPDFNSYVTAVVGAEFDHPLNREVR